MALMASLQPYITQSFSSSINFRLLSQETLRRLKVKHLTWSLALVSSEMEAGCDCGTICSQWV